MPLQLLFNILAHFKLALIFEVGQFLETDAHPQQIASLDNLDILLVGVTVVTNQHVELFVLVNDQVRHRSQHLVVLLPL